MALHAPFFVPLLAHSKNGVLAKKEWKHLGSTVEAERENDVKKAVDHMSCSTIFVHLVIYFRQHVDIALNTVFLPH